MLLRGYIERYGVKAVMGRDVLSYGEMRRMEYANNIVTAYQSLQESARENGGWAGWRERNPTTALALDEARSLAEELGDDSNG